MYHTLVCCMVEHSNDIALQTLFHGLLWQLTLVGSDVFKIVPDWKY